MIDLLGKFEEVFANWPQCVEINTSGLGLATSRQCFKYAFFSWDAKTISL
jgi:hypothetical protein